MPTGTLYSSGIQSIDSTSYAQFKIAAVYRIYKYIKSLGASTPWAVNNEVYPFEIDWSATTEAAFISSCVTNNRSPCFSLTTLNVGQWPDTIQKPEICIGATIDGYAPGTNYRYGIYTGNNVSRMYIGIDPFGSFDDKAPYGFTNSLWNGYCDYDLTAANGWTFNYKFSMDDYMIAFQMWRTDTTETLHGTGFFAGRILSDFSSTDDPLPCGYCIGIPSNNDINGWGSINPGTQGRIRIRQADNPGSWAEARVNFDNIDAVDGLGYGKRGIAQDQSTYYAIPLQLFSGLYHGYPQYHGIAADWIYFVSNEVATKTQDGSIISPAGYAF